MEENEDSLSYSRFSKGSISKLQTFVRRASDAISNQSSIKADGFKRAITGQSRRDVNSSLAISQLENMNATSFQLELTMNQNILDSQREMEEPNQQESIDEKQELQDQVDQQNQDNTQNEQEKKDSWNKIKSFGQLATQLIKKKSSSHVSTFKKQISSVRQALKHSDSILRKEQESNNQQSIGMFESIPQESTLQEDGNNQNNQYEYLRQEDSEQEEVPLQSHHLIETSNKIENQKLQFHEQSSIVITENYKELENLVYDEETQQNKQEDKQDVQEIEQKEQKQEDQAIEQEEVQIESNNQKNLQKLKKGIQQIIPLITLKAQKSLQTFKYPQQQQSNSKIQSDDKIHNINNTDINSNNQKVEPNELAQVQTQNIKIEDQEYNFNENEQIMNNDDSRQNNQLNYSLQQQDDNQFQDLNISKQNEKEYTELNEQEDEVEKIERKKLGEFKQFFQKAPQKILEKHQSLMRTLTQEISKIVQTKQQERQEQHYENVDENQNQNQIEPVTDKQYREATQIDTYSNEQNEFENESYDISYGVSKDPQQQEQIFDSQYVKDQYEQITLDLQQLQAEKKRLFNQPRKQANSQIPFKPNYKHLADISDDNEAIYRAKALVKKMNEQRKQHQQRIQRQNQKIDNYFKIDLSQLKNQQEQYIQRKEYTKKQSIQDRIDQYERKKREFLELQQVSQNFVRNLIHIGPQQGQLSKEVDDQAKQIKQSNQQIKLNGMIIKFPPIKRSSPKIDLQQKYEQIMSLRNDKLPLLRYK